MDVQLVVRSWLWLCIHVLKSGEDFAASTSLRFQNVIPVPALAVKPTFSCKTALMLCRINSKINKLNGLRTILLVKSKRVSLFIPQLQNTCVVVHMHPCHATNLLACLLMCSFFSFPLHKDRCGHSSQCCVLGFVTHSCFFLLCVFPVY